MFPEVSERGTPRIGPVVRALKVSRNAPFVIVAAKLTVCDRVDTPGTVAHLGEDADAGGLPRRDPWRRLPHQSSALGKVNWLTPPTVRMRAARCSAMTRW